MDRHLARKASMVIHCLLRSISAVVLALAFWGASALAPVVASAETSGGWVAAEVAGHVSERSADGQWQPVASGSALPDGARIKTGPDGRLVLSHNNDTVTLSPNSELELPRKADGASAPGLLQTLGTLLFRVEHSPGRRFEVDAPYLAAVVKGTVFTVSVCSTGNSVHVAEGAVEVTTSVSHQVALVRPGQTAVVSSAGRDLSIVDGTRPQRRSESDGTDGKAKARSADAGDATHGADGVDRGRHGAQITRTLGDQHLDVAGLSQGLVQDGDSQRARLANANAGGGNANAGGGNANAGGGSANSGGDNGNASGGNANGGGSNANASGGNANAGGGNASAGGGSANVGGSNPNAAGGGNPNANAGGGNPAAAGSNSNAGGGSSNAVANAGGGNPNAAGGNPGAAAGNPNAAGGNPNAAGNNPNAAANRPISHGKH